MSWLGIAEYDSEERHSLEYLPSDAIRAFQPVAFRGEGHVTNARSEKELVNFIDTMHETRFESDYKTWFKGFTRREFELALGINRALVDYTQSHFGQAFVTRATLVRAMNVVRHIGFLTSSGGPLRIFEVGPGSGYVGAFLHLLGHTYASTDVTQGFYVYQNHLLNALSGGKVVDLVTRKESFFDAMHDSHLVHVPWWKFAALPGLPIPSFDIVTCNHCVTEMHPMSLAFTVRVFREMLNADNSSWPKAVIFEGWGHPHYNTQSEVCRIFYERGFRLIFSDDFYTILVRADSAHANACLSPCEILKPEFGIANNQLSISTRTERSFYGHHEPRENQLVQTYLRNRDKFESEPRVSFDELMESFRKLAGRENLLTPNEAFAVFAELAPSTLQ
jgi:hypothetical protein